jgi:glycerol-3-phosphate dehydrogenase
MTEAMTGEHEIFDVAVIGGGVNGCGVARDLQGRGARVVLIEAADLAGGTSSASTKLIHGGLRYLEYYEFRLVREALMERERLWAMAPHIIWPLRFVLPHHKALRPAWMLRLGLFLYDHLGGRKLLPPTRTLDLTKDPTGAGLAPGFRRGFEYSDAWVEDARLVALNALDAAERGATILTRTKAVGFERHADHWRIEIDAGGERRWLKARALVNTAGPWAGEVLAKTGVNSPSKVRLVKGSHIVVRRLFQHDRAYIFQNGDGRVCFAIPYEQDFTLIGTTDVDFKDDPREVTASVDEIAYLCQAVSEYLARPVTPADVVWTYAGVRPLLDDGSGKPESATRDYVLERHDAGGAALVSVFGGKITTYRRLAEAVVAELKEVLPAAARPGWTASQPLPGGEFPVQSFAALVEELRAAYPWLAPELARRLARAYGRRAWRLLGEAKSMADLGQDFGAGLTAREVDYLRQTEWARTAEDVLWRRSKLGLRLTAEQVRALSDFMTG